MTIWNRRTIVLAMAAFAAAVLCRPDPPLQAGEATADAGRGKQIFQRFCVGCHGPEGRGDGYKMLGPKPADLASPSTQKKSDRELLRTLHEGKPNMPAWKRRLSEPQARDVLAYVRTLRRNP